MSCLREIIVEDVGNVKRCFVSTITYVENVRFVKFCSNEQNLTQWNTWELENVLDI